MYPDNFTLNSTQLYLSFTEPKRFRSLKELSESLNTNFSQEIVYFSATEIKIQMLFDKAATISYYQKDKLYVHFNDTNLSLIGSISQQKLDTSPE